MRPFAGARRLLPYILLSGLPAGVLGGDTLTTTGYTSCQNNATIKVTKLDVTYNRKTNLIVYNLAGESTEEQNVTAILTVTAYGKEVYSKTFSPCDEDISEMCPVPARSFTATGSEIVPDEYASQIPSIVFSIPDLDGDVKMQLKSNTQQDVGCIESTVGNGHTLNMPSVSYVAAGIAGAAFAVSGVGAVAAAGHPGAASTSPTFIEVMGWFQGMAMNGMLSVQYPRVYQSFTTNFAFSTGLIPWASMQKTIDNFRANTGGNLTHNNYEYLSNGTTLIYSQSSNSSSASRKMRRALDTVMLWARAEVSSDGETTTVSGSGSTTTTSTTSNSTTEEGSKVEHYVHGIQAYVEELQIPSGNTFMTVLLVWAIIVGAIIVLILLLKVILEAWSMFGNIPKSMESWRQRYWWRLAKVLTNLILLAYGTWTMYCIYQWTDGDSWAAKVLAGVSFALFTAVLSWFTWRIWSKVHRYRRLAGEGGAAANTLYEDKETWVKYNLFYENYKKGYWWLFVPAIVYMCARGAIIAAANGHGLIQSGGQIIVEALYLALLLWLRPYQRKSGTWINVVIQVVRVLSVVCVLVFVEELGISQTTKTITGVILIVVQGVLTAVLAILIAVNSLIACIKTNPHRQARKEKDRLNREFDDLTPLDARNSLLMDDRRVGGDDTGMYKAPIVASTPFGVKKARYDPVPARSVSPPQVDYADNSFTRTPRSTRRNVRGDDGEFLVSGAASMGHRTEESRSRSPSREPRLPEMDFGRAY